ncbi:hypothetical protein K470DRAFT_255104 [Piedraia hortae CBS 480.64]|uniref:Uncharacterized protein n=1 Tax=Piedraia hortae CBS 480.64 TaxID=1314780 RepID=A0A6A7C9W3_9PEZI|nr:hypothetical protein K470DRAFT_255104 [Piedraia hortae CBS 480.64]
MSEKRSASAVRNLRSMFETKSSEAAQTQDVRGRSTPGDGHSNSRPNSTVRASFVPVDVPVMDDDMPGLKKVTSASLRRGSFSEGSDLNGSAPLKKPLSTTEPPGESVNETMPETAIESSAVSSVGEQVANPTQPSEEGVNGNGVKEALISDKSNATPEADQHKDTEMPRPSETTPPMPEEKPSATAAEETHKSKPAASTKAAEGASAKVGKMADSGKAKPASKHTSIAKAGGPGLTKKPSRPSLTAPTAASLARSQSAPTANGKHSPTTKPKTTKPVDLPSRLTAPTAASRAKHETAPTSAFNGKTSVASSRTKPAVSKPAPRPSISRGPPPAATASKKPATSDGSFLERMMRPTAASASKVHEKFEVKSPPRRNSSTAKRISKTMEPTTEEQPEAANVEA